MRPLYKVCLIATALAAAGPVLAQSAPPKDDEGEEIVVTGTRDLDGEIKNFVGALAQSSPRGQLSRFEQSVCPTAIGLSPSLKQTVVRRMKAIAKAASIRIGAEGCIPNVLVIVTPDKPAFLQGLARKHGYYFGNLSPSEVRKLVREPGPATAWQLNGAPMDSDGIVVPTDSSSGVPINRTLRSGSRIAPATRQHFSAAALVVDARALEGLTTTQLADYAAMRLFARTDPAKLPAASPPSILKVLDTPMGGEVPVTLTAWDLGFLRGLYTSDSALYAPSQRSEIAKQVNKTLGETARQPD